MMGNPQHVLLALLGLIVLHAKAQSILFTGLDSFRPGTNYEASVASLSNSQLSVTVSIVNNNTGQVIAVQDATVLSGTQAPFSLQIPNEVDESAKYYVRVQEGLSYDNQTEIHLKRKTRSVFITTDKSIYKPGATVKFRTFAVDVFLVPKNDPITVEILDPKGNKIKQWRDQLGQNGVVSGELELSTLTALGAWKIKVTSVGEETTETFQVEEYTLPKFEVSVTMNPTFVVSSKDPMQITARVTAKYNIGTPVDGELVLTVRQERDWYNIQKQTISRQISGVVNVDVRFPGGTFVSCGICAMIVEAEVTDSLSGEKRKSSSKFQTWRDLEKLEFINRPEFIKSGLATRFQLKLTQQDGSPLLDTGKKVTVKVTENYQQFPNEGNNAKVSDYSFSLPASGLLMIDHQTAPNATNLRIEAEYNGVKATDYVSQQFKSLSGNSIEIEQGQNGNQVSDLSY
ncbi:CD109 antigen-like [Liolophura sinensis]|uniref:CD109 antigen-like n=1 Tax=Liolophura sinensis TaxID=3198878 RepID=UPI0031597398